jgi:1-acyl-sn-glycerol-3-phosphate acyltransferase
MPNPLVAAVRMLRGGLHLCAGLWTVLVRFPGMSPHAREATVQAWARTMLRLIAIELRVEGSPPTQGPVLLASNHISWLDILVLHAARHCRFVSKAEVRHWPMIGTMATAAGTLYIERASRRDAMRLVHNMADRLRAGDILAVFPEGTIGDGRQMLPFHANLLQAAISADAPVQPVALRFIDAATGTTSFAPCYADGETLLGSVWRTLCAPPIAAMVRFGEPGRAEGRDRRAWAHALASEVDRLRGGTVGHTR